MLNILDWFRGRSTDGRTAAELYGSIVSQARQPAFYNNFGVADVAEKRYEMIVLHTVLTLERLRACGPYGMTIAQGIVEAFVRDLDGSMRELAVGDTKVPAKVKKAAGGLFDRDMLYRDAIETSRTSDADTAMPSGADRDDMTPQALLDELIFDGRGPDRADALWQYVEQARAELSVWRIDAGQAVTTPPFPRPEANHLANKATA